MGAQGLGVGAVAGVQQAPGPGATDDGLLAVPVDRSRSSAEPVEGVVMARKPPHWHPKGERPPERESQERTHAYPERAILARPGQLTPKLASTTAAVRVARSSLRGDVDAACERGRQLSGRTLTPCRKPTESRFVVGAAELEPACPASSEFGTATQRLPYRCSIACRSLWYDGSGGRDSCAICRSNRSE